LTVISHNTELPAALRGALEEILENIRRGRTDGILELSALLQEVPNSLETMGHLAWALAHKGRYGESVDLYRRYVMLQPENIEIRYRIGDRLVNLGRLDEALEVYRDVLKENPDCLDAKVGMRYVNYLKKRKPEQITSLDRGPLKPTAPQQQNLELNEKEFKGQRIAVHSLPPRLYLESTTKCNFYCRICIRGYDPYYAEDLREDILSRVAREMMPANVRISLTGFGEPTMAKNFARILELCLANGSHVHFVTNGSLLNFKRIEQLSRSPVTVSISMDGATKETLESIRCGANFELLCDKLAMIKRLREIYLSEAYSFFSIIFVAIRQNIHELPDLVRLAHRYGITSVSVCDYAFISTDVDEQSLRFDPIRANRYLEEARKVAEHLGIDLELPPPYSIDLQSPPKASLCQRIRRVKRILSIPNRFPQRCHSPWMEPYIHTDGKVSPCCASSAISLGDMKRNSFREIWNGWRYRLLRFRINSLLPPLYCRDCCMHWGINGGNAGNIMAKEGLLVKMFYFCESGLNNFVARAHNCISKMANRVKGVEITSPRPNFFHGRRIV
jgi:MoaA/NifB/PqqE/SkfB family radical SAM enzyme